MKITPDAVLATPSEIALIARHFCIAALWADSPEGTNPGVTAQATKAAIRFAAEFVDAYPDLYRRAMEAEGYGSHPDAGSPQAAFGHDLYLTAVGRGVGFWDRPELGSTGEALTEALRADRHRWYVETEFYRGWMYLVTNFADY